MRIEVLGAGCLGLSAALALAQRGHEVTVLDPRGVGGGATGRGAGIVSTMTWNDDDFHLIQATRGQIGQLAALAAAEGMPEARLWKSHDSITIAGGRTLAMLDEIQHRLERLGEEPERLDARMAAAQWPTVRFAAGEEVLVAQEDGAVEAGDLAALLAWAAAQEGATMRVGPHAGVVRSGVEGTIQAASVGGSTTASHGADATVVAAGAWTPGVLAQRGAALPLASFRTQLASIEVPSHGVPILHDTVNGFYVRPESAHSVLAGNGTVLRPHDPDAYDESADADFRHSIARRVVDRLVGGDAARWRNGWAGLCVGTPDRHPVCGAVPGHDDLFVLSGDNGFGIMRCLALGERLADAVDGDEATVTSPARFAGFEADWRLQEGFAW